MHDRSRLIHYVPSCFNKSTKCYQWIQNCPRAITKVATKSLRNVCSHFPRSIQPKLLCLQFSQSYQQQQNSHPTEFGRLHESPDAIRLGKTKSLEMNYLP
ncbi:hypothetical protein GYH30_017661 [Glycine max]|nr:hypothetical protein GYH30_017661 [Glycine max]